MNNSYISNFDTTAELATFSATTQFMKPHVSFTKDNDEVHYFKYDPYNGHAYVDLGLTSGLKWATMNIGATSETDYGLYFQWGDTKGYTADQVGSGEGKKEFTWNDYKYSLSGSSSATGMTKYNETDKKKVLDLEDDAVAANWGGSWRMPTYGEFQSMINETHKRWTGRTVNNETVYGYECAKSGDTDFTGDTLFFPAAGYFLDGSFHDVGSSGDYWSSSISSSGVIYGMNMRIISNTIYMGVYGRRYGFPVRGVVS